MNLNLKSFDYEEHENFWQSIKHLKRKEIEKLYDQKYNGFPTFCIWCGVFYNIVPVYWCVDGTTCEECFNFWGNKKPKLEILLKTAKTAQARKVWQYWIEERKSKQ